MTWARKMTFRALYRLERHQLLDAPSCRASDDMSVGQLVKWGSRVHRSYRKIDDAVFGLVGGPVGLPAR